MIMDLRVNFSNFAVFKIQSLEDLFGSSYVFCAFLSLSLCLVISSERATDSGNAVAPINEQSERPYEVGVQPCSTLFIANLGPNCTEDELKQTLSVYPGFNMLKMRARGGMPVAFADFEEVEQASTAMEGLQDSTLPSSDRGGMHIEYARSKMRKL